MTMKHPKGWKRRKTIGPYRFEFRAMYSIYGEDQIETRVYRARDGKFLAEFYERNYGQSLEALVDYARRRFAIEQEEYKDIYGVLLE